MCTVRGKKKKLRAEISKLDIKRGKNDLAYFWDLHIFGLKIVLQREDILL